MYPAGSGHTYSRVCGNVIGYKQGSTDSFGSHIDDINKSYVDGFSVTYGSSRKHLWTYAIHYRGAYTCDNSLAFVNGNYYCEGSDDALFVGKWFCVELPRPTTERLELRVCRDESITDEDPLLQFAAFFVQ